MATILQLAQMCENAYDGASESSVLTKAQQTALLTNLNAPGANGPWRVLLTSGQADLTQNHNEDWWDDGYFGVAYYNNDTHELVIANRGSVTFQNFVISDADLATTWSGRY